MPVSDLEEAPHTTATQHPRGTIKMNCIRTRRMLLRPAGKQDLKQLHQVFSNPAAMQYWDSLPHSHPAQTAETLDRMIGTPLSRGEDFIVEFNGRAIGKAGFWRFPKISFIFHPDQWGMGLATEAVTALVEHGLQKRKLPAITADVDPRNSRSIRLLEKLGFVESHREANTIKIGDNWCDSVYFFLETPGARRTAK